MTMDKKGYLLIGSSEESKKILVDLLVKDISCMRFGSKGNPTIENFKEYIFSITPSVPCSYLVLENVGNGFQMEDLLKKLHNIGVNLAIHKPYLAAKRIIVCSCTYKELRELKYFDFMMKRYAVIDTDLPVTKALTDYLKNKKN